MTINQSGFGLSAFITASNTFPDGIVLTAFPDDTDPMENPPLQVTETGMGLNGNMVAWSRPAVIEVALSVITTTQDDLNLEALEDANRVSLGKVGAQDNIHLVINYPNGRKRTLQNGVIAAGPILPVVVNSGRYQTRTYRFRFENIAAAN